MTINYRIQTFDNQQPPQMLKTIKIRNAQVLPTVNQTLNIDLEDYIVTEVRHRVGYKKETYTNENGIQSDFQAITDIDVTAVKKEDSVTYSLK